MILCSFSGGRTSAFMAAMLKKSGKCEHFVFANTGKEREETLQFIDQCDKAFGLNVVWLEPVFGAKGKGTRHKVVDFKTAARNGEPMAEGAKKYGLPNVNNPWCTRELKKAVQESWARENMGHDYVFAIGIRPDEKHRAVPKKGVTYPLLDLPGLDAAFIRRWWAVQPFDLGLKSHEGNCDLCFKKSLRKRMTLIAERPGIETWWENLENQHSDGGKYLLDMRAGISIPEIRAQAKRPFQRASESGQCSLFDSVLDWERDCFCKS